MLEKGDKNFTEIEEILEKISENLQLCVESKENLNEMLKKLKKLKWVGNLKKFFIKFKEILKVPIRVIATIIFKEKLNVGGNRWKFEKVVKQLTCEYAVAISRKMSETVKRQPAF